MKYKVTLNNRTYEVEVEAGQAMLVDEYEVYAPAPAAVPARRRSSGCRIGLSSPRTCRR